MESTSKSSEIPIEKTQKYLLLDWLTMGKKITFPIAARQLMIGSLARRICDLKEMGYGISSRYIDYYRADGYKTHIKEYWMPETEIQKREEYLQQLRDRLTLRANPSKCLQ